MRTTQAGVTGHCWWRCWGVCWPRPGQPECQGSRGRPSWRTCRWRTGTAASPPLTGIQGATDAQRIGPGALECRGGAIAGQQRSEPGELRADPGEQLAGPGESLAVADEQRRPAPGARPRISPPVVSLSVRTLIVQHDAPDFQHDFAGQLHVQLRVRRPSLPRVRVRSGLPQPLHRRPGTDTADHPGQQPRHVGRLQSVHASLARIDHDYKGHRVRAMHSVSMAIRQLSHRSMVYSGEFAGMNNGGGVGDGTGDAAERWAAAVAAASITPGPVRRPHAPVPAQLAGDRHATEQSGFRQHGPCPSPRTPAA